MVRWEMLRTRIKETSDEIESLFLSLPSQENSETSSLFVIPVTGGTSVQWLGAAGLPESHCLNASNTCRPDLSHRAAS